MEPIIYVILCLFISALINLKAIPMLWPVFFNQKLIIDKKLVEEKNANESRLKNELLKANEQISKFQKKQQSLLDKDEELKGREKKVQKDRDEMETTIRTEVEKRVSDKLKSLESEISTLEREKGNLVREIKKSEQTLFDLTKEIEDALQKKKDLLTTISTLKQELPGYRQPQIHIEAGGDIIFPNGIKRVEIDSSEYTDSREYIDSRRDIKVMQYSDSRSCQYSDSSRNLSVLDQSNKSRRRRTTNQAEFSQQNQLTFYPVPRASSSRSSGSSFPPSLYESPPSPLALCEGSSFSSPLLLDEEGSREEQHYLHRRRNKK